MLKKALLFMALVLGAAMPMYAEEAAADPAEETAVVEEAGEKAPAEDAAAEETKTE